MRIVRAICVASSAACVEQNATFVQHGQYVAKEFDDGCRTQLPDQKNGIGFFKEGYRVRESFRRNVREHVLKGGNVTDHQVAQETNFATISAGTQLDVQSLDACLETRGGG